MNIPCEEIPIYCGLIVAHGFDPDHPGPSIPQWEGLGINPDAPVPQPPLKEECHGDQIL